MLVAEVPHVKIMAMAAFHQVAWKVSAHWPWSEILILISKWVFSLPVSGLRAQCFGIPQKSLCSLLLSDGGLLHFSLRDLRRRAELHTMHSSDPDPTATVQAYGWLMKMFRMFGIASHLVRSNVPRRSVLDFEIEQGREMLLQNKSRITTGHKTCVLGVTGAELLLYVVFELTSEFIKGKMESNNNKKKSYSMITVLLLSAAGHLLLTTSFQLQKLGRMPVQQ